MLEDGIQRLRNVVNDMLIEGADRGINETVGGTRAPMGEF